MGEREVNEQWAAWLRQRMRARGFATPTELGRASGVDQSVISRWLNEGRTPQVDQLRKVTGPLQATMPDLLVAAGYVTKSEVSSADGSPAEQSPIDVPEAIEYDPVLTERARRHLLDQYEMLRELSQGAASKTTPAQKPLRAVARKRPPRQDRS